MIIRLVLPGLVGPYENSIGIAHSVYMLGYGLDDRGSIPGKGKRCFLFSFASRLAAKTEEADYLEYCDTFSTLPGNRSCGKMIFSIAIQIKDTRWIGFIRHKGAQNVSSSENVCVES
jgi:hypothetical protein